MTQHYRNSSLGITNHFENFNTANLVQNFQKTKSQYEQKFQQMMAANLDLKKFEIVDFESQGIPLKADMSIRYRELKGPALSNPRIAFFEKMIDEDAKFLKFMEYFPK